LPDLPYGLNGPELRLLRRLSTPAKIQRYLDHLDYNLEKGGETCRSPRRVIRDRTAHCLEAALLAAAAFRIHGRAPRLVDLTAVRDQDHVLAVFQAGSHWGAVASSKFSGLRFREPVYRDLRELVMSYFEHYYNPAGEKTLRSYSQPVNLRRFDRRAWMTAEEELWDIADYLTIAPHTRVITPAMARHLQRLDSRLKAAGELGAPH
jgi:hypothetical protein